MTKNFVDRLGRRNVRIPLSSSLASETIIDEDYVLVVPSYGAGKNTSAVPKQVIKFLNNKQNRDHLVGIAGSGSLNYQDKYCLGARIVAAKCDVPLLFTYELTGLPEDVLEFNQILDRVWENTEERESDATIHAST